MTQRSVHGSCTIGDDDYVREDGVTVAVCDECGAEWPQTEET